MSSINHWRCYRLGKEYPDVKKRAKDTLGKYFEDPKVMKFNDVEKTVRFKTELLIPAKRTSRSQIMLLFSNPHPHSIQQGMFLSPSSNKRKSSIWKVMRDAGWFPSCTEDYGSERLREMFLRVEYPGPFEFLFCCYYAFPTTMPEQIRGIFGDEFFDEVIKEKARKEFARRTEDTHVAVIVTFNKSIFNLITNSKIPVYIERLKGGNVVSDWCRNGEKKIPVFLTYPTGWRYHKKSEKLRVKNLKLVKDDILKYVK